MKIKDFINGFRKIEYSIPLETKPEVFNFSINGLVDISRKLDTIPFNHILIKPVDISIHKYNKFEYPEMSMHLFKDKSVNHCIKVSDNRYRVNEYREMLVESTTHFIGIDDNLWILTGYVLLTLPYVNTVFDKKLINLAIDGINNLMNQFEFYNMCKNINKEDFKIPYVDQIPITKRVYSEGKTTVFGNVATRNSMSDWIKDYSRMDAHITIDAAGITDIEHFISDETYRVTSIENTRN